MQITVIQDSTNNTEIAESFHKLSAEGNNSALMILIAENAPITQCGFLDYIPVEIPVFGGIFPKIIHQNKILDRGIIILSIQQEIEIIPIEDLSEIDRNTFSNLFSNKLLDEEFKTLITFVDGRSAEIEQLISELFNFYGIELNFVGGGCGSLSSPEISSILIGNKLYKNAAVLAALKANSSVGVKHGWQKLAGPFSVTDANKNIISKIDGQPAFQFYKTTIKKYGNVTVNSENFSAISRGFPFGIGKFDQEEIIRDPILIGTDDSLICVGEIAQNSLIYIMKGEENNIIEAAGEAYNEALTNFRYKNDYIIFFIDCISRSLFLEESFQQEIDIVNKNPNPMIGVLSLGEIANSGKDFLEFFNKTAVVALIEKI